MRRRQVIALLTAWTADAILEARSHAARAEGMRRRYRLGVLAPSPRSIEPVRALVLPELARLGFVEGVNLTLDFRAGAEEELPRIAREMVSAVPDAVLSIAPLATRAVQDATRTIPILMFGGEDAILEGFAQTLARPDANVTAVVIRTYQLEPKRLELLHEALPAIRRVAALVYQDAMQTRQQYAAALHGAATALGLDLQIVVVHGEHEFATAFAAMRSGGAEGLLIGAHTVLFQHREKLAALAINAGLPTTCEWAEMARDGCLLGYGPDRPALYRNVARKLARLFNGSSLADLPIEQPSSFPFAVNLRTAKALGLVIPPTLLARAEEVIE